MIRRMHVVRKSCAIIIQKGDHGYYATCFWGHKDGDSVGRFSLDKCHRLITKGYSKKYMAMNTMHKICKGLGLFMMYKEDWTGRSDV